MRFFFLLWAILFFLLNLPCKAEVATHSFTNLSGRGTYPLSVSIEGRTLRVDLSPLRGANHIYRAHLFINVNPYWSSRFRKVPEQKFCLVTNFSPQRCASTVPPRHIYFDLTEDVREALTSGNYLLEVKMKEAPAYGFGNPAWQKDADGRVLIHLDVTCDLPLPAQAPRAEIPILVKAYHRQGDTLLLWRDPSPLTTSEELTVEEYKNLLRRAEGPPHQIRFRLYRSSNPITPETIARAELLDEIGPLSVWDEEFLGQWWRKERALVPRMPFENERIARPEENIYVHHSRERGAFYYAVVKVLDGQEDLSQIIPGENSLSSPIEEEPGPGLVLLRKREIRENFYYVNGPIEMNFFVKWEAPPNANLPSTPFNYLVARSLNPEHRPQGGKHPVNINLHCWGGSLLNGFLWWYEAERGSLLLTTNQRPYDWWTGYNEAYGTYLSFSEHPVYNYTQRRIESFLKDFVFKNWPVDRERIILSGSSMGGSGTVMWGLRRPDLFAYLKGEVGVYIPLESPQFKESFYGIYGHPSWPVKYADTQLSPYEYWDTARWLRENPKQETPFLIFANGRNDHAIGWAQAWKVVKALKETRRPFVFRWANQGHSTRSLFPAGGDRTPTISPSRDQSLPAFSNCSLDTPLGDTPEESPDKGQINYYLLWKTEDLIDEDDHWEVTLYLSSNAPENRAEVDITPRRVKNFEITPEHSYSWENILLPSGEVIQQGVVRPQRDGLLTIRRVLVSKGGNRLRIRLSSHPSSQGQDNQNENATETSECEEENSPEILPVELPPFEEIPEGEKTVLRPSEAGRLPEIVRNAPPGHTIFLRDGLYRLPRTIEIKKEGITLRSLTGQPERVVLTGEFRIGEIINIQAPGVTIAGLTIKEAFYHALHLGGGAHHTKLIRLHLLDCGEQLIKVNPNRLGVSNDYGLLALSLLEYTDAGRLRIRDALGGGSCYTNGIDILKARGWRIVGNTFRNIYCPPGRSLPQAILVWQGSRDTIIERNRILNCPIGIQLGLGSNRRRVYEDLDFTASHIGGIVRNNFVFADENHKFDTGIGLWAARGTLVLNNTVYTPLRESFASIDLRFDETEALVWNNLLFREPRLRQGARADLMANLVARDEWFLDPQAGDLHLKKPWPEVIDQGKEHSGIKDDIDGEKRCGTPDIGADEWSGLYLRLEPEGKTNFSTEELLSLWVYLFPSTPYQEIFLWAETPFGRFCYTPENFWFPCQRPVRSACGPFPATKHLAFQGSLQPDRYKIYLSGDEEPDNDLRNRGVFTLQFEILKKDF